MPPNNKVCSRHDQSISRIHETVNRVHESNARIETQLDNMVKATNGMHSDLYDKSNGVIVKQVELTQQGKDQKKLLWLIMGGIVAIGAKVLIKGF